MNKSVIFHIFVQYNLEIWKIFHIFAARNRIYTTSPIHCTMVIQREVYLQELIKRKHNGLIKVITGIRRCGKSFLLFNLFTEHLHEQGVSDSHIVKVDLENRHNSSLRNPDELMAYIDSRLTDDGMHYVLLDEVQLVDEFEDVLNSYLKVPNADVYVTGSNSKFLSKDVLTEFRGRGDEVKIAPLSFSEYFSVANTSQEQALRDYIIYGGLPVVALTPEAGLKRKYLKDLFSTVYFRDIRERYHIRQEKEMEEIISILASSIGGLINPTKLQNTFKSVKNTDISKNTIISYLDILQDVFMVEKAVRYDIKGKKYIDTPSKYYFEDLGLRNASLNFRQVEETHLMENLIYDELRRRGYFVDVGEVVIMEPSGAGKKTRKQLEVDFVCNRGYDRVYIQSAFSLPTAEKREQEFRPLKLIDDSFQKVVVVGGAQPTYRNDDGILVLNIYDFLLHGAAI